MTRTELITEWCAGEGKKKVCLNAAQAQECWRILRQIVGEEVGIDIEDVIAGRSVCIDASGLTNKCYHYEAFRVYAWKGGKPVK